MPIIALIVLSLLLLILCAMTAFMICLLWASFFTKVPFVPIRKAILKDVAEALKLEEGSKLYDLGCGDARVLIACYQSQPAAQYVGIEKDLIPWTWARLRLIRLKKPHGIKVLRKNFFKQDISDATHVFTYLLPEMMDRLLPKFRQELKPGTKLVACDFPFKEKEPVEVITFDWPEKKLGRRLLIYEF